MQAKRILATLGLLVGGVLLRPAFARADTITTFNVSATTGNLKHLTGTFQVDVTVGTVLSSSFNITYPGSVFDNLMDSGPYETSEWIITAESQDEEVLMILDFTTTKTPGSLVGFTGGTITGGEGIYSDYELAFALRTGGTIKPVPEPEGVPEPSSLALLAVGVLAWLPIGFARRRVLNYRSNGGPAKNRAKDVVEIGELQLVGDQDQANNHRTDLT